MSRKHKRKTGWRSTPPEEMEGAAAEVKQGKSLRAEVKERRIDRSILSRFIHKKEDKGVKTVGYSGTAQAKV